MGRSRAIGSESAAVDYIVAATAPFDVEAFEFCSNLRWHRISLGHVD
jgi:hypothetical protein